VLDCDEFQEPIVGGEAKRKIGQCAWALRQHSHKPNDVRTGWLVGEWIPSGGGDHFAPTANYDLRFKWQSTKQFSTQSCLADRVADDKGPGRADINDVTIFQLFRKDAWLKGLVPSDVHALQKNNLFHSLLPLCIH